MALAFQTLNAASGRVALAARVLCATGVCGPAKIPSGLPSCASAPLSFATSALQAWAVAAWLAALTCLTRSTRNSLPSSKARALAAALALAAPGSAPRAALRGSAARWDTVLRTRILFCRCLRLRPARDACSACTQAPLSELAAGLVLSNKGQHTNQSHKGLSACAVRHLRVRLCCAGGLQSYQTKLQQQQQQAQAQHGCSGSQAYAALGISCARSLKPGHRCPAEAPQCYPSCVLHTDMAPCSIVSSLSASEYFKKAGITE